MSSIPKRLTEETGKRTARNDYKSDLAEHGVRVGVHRIKRIRKEHGIRCKQVKKFKATTNSNHALPIAENVLEQKFVANAPNQAWVTDLTYIPTAEGGCILPVIKTSSLARSSAMRWERE